ncbi:MAG: class I SAM-dependent methyltransferase [Candidatus Dormiibacterota bacterium]
MQDPAQEERERTPPGDAGEPGAPGTYLFPRDPKEVNRLDLQHYALREALYTNYLAPVSNPARILDAGTGTGQWAFDLCREFPDALTVGMDVGLSSKLPGPPTYRFVRGSIAEGLPFKDRTFDFVHQRLLRAGIPAAAWGTVVGDLARVTRPGGWVELAEIRNGIDPAGAATRRLFDLLLQLSAALKLDVDGPPRLALDGLLASAGLVEIETRPVVVPVGEWGGRMGSFMASNTRAMFTGLASTFETRFSVSRAETVGLVRAMLQEVEAEHGTCTIVFAWGRQPA